MRSHDDHDFPRNFSLCGNCRRKHHQTPIEGLHWWLRLRCCSLNFVSTYILHHGHPSLAELISIVMKSVDGISGKRCQGEDCPNEAGTLQCPTCQKQGTDSFFCSQDCFKKNWVRLPAASYKPVTLTIWTGQAQTWTQEAE